MSIAFKGNSISGNPVLSFQSHLFPHSLLDFQDFSFFSFKSRKVLLLFNSNIILFIFRASMTWLSVRSGSFHENITIILNFKIFALNGKYSRCKQKPIYNYHPEMKGNKWKSEKCPHRGKLCIEESYDVYGRVIFMSSVRIFKKILILIIISKKIYSWRAHLLLNTMVYVLCWKISWNFRLLSILVNTLIKS